ncbi:signal peptidase complex subunit 3 [Octopus sinensis]|uniref:Signal peptidase complex subunit 3 n=1 Tax=Octopus sinensis TaxID=2607531 RepID=A0A6P7T2B2_9MOLL|nr:signal peptidase complex subunit 3 [Octopus sinensis]
MNTFLSRANTIFAFTLSVMAVLTFACFLSTGLINLKADTSIKTGRVHVKNLHDYQAERERSDLGYFVFDLYSDISRLFNWNVKLLFLYLTAEYETADHKFNQVIIWDKIIRRGENALLDYRSMNTKYHFWDLGNGLRGNKNVTLSLSWNVIPNAGTLPKVCADGKYNFAFPDHYTSFRP